MYTTGRKRRLIMAGIIFILLITYSLIPTYLVNALLHGYPDLDDYRHFNNRVVAAGKIQPWPESRHINAIRIPDTLLTKMEKYETVAFLVIQHGEIIHEQYWEGYGRDSYSNSFSMAKSIVSLLIGIAIEEGLIDSVNQRVGDFLPEFAQGPKSEIRIRDLLTMSSGLSWEEAYSTPMSITTQAYYGDRLRAITLEQEVEEAPGRNWEYLSGDTELLALILERVIGTTISEYASEHLWKKMGAVHDALWSLDRKNGIEKAYCCFNSNAADFARFGQLVLNHGYWNGQPVVDSSYLSQALTPADYLVDDEGDPVNFYGFQWWIAHYKDQKIPYMRGILGQYVFAIPEKDAVVVRLGKKRSGTYQGDITLDALLYLQVSEYLLQQYGQ